MDEQLINDWIFLNSAKYQIQLSDAKESLVIDSLPLDDRSEYKYHKDIQVILKCSERSNLSCDNTRLIRVKYYIDPNSNGATVFYDLNKDK